MMPRDRSQACRWSRHDWSARAIESAVPDGSIFDLDAVVVVHDERETARRLLSVEVVRKRVEGEAICVAALVERRKCPAVRLEGPTPRGSIQTKTNMCLVEKEPEV